MTGTWVALGAVVVALAFGAWRAFSDGRFRGTHAVRGAEPAFEEHREPLWASLGQDGDLGERATLVQFSSAFCAPCRATRRILEEVTGLVPGVRHVEIDAEHHLEVVRQVGIVRTPTTLVLDAAGREVTRATGAPTKAQVLAALAAI